MNNKILWLSALIVAIPLGAFLAENFNLIMFGEMIIFALALVFIVLMLLCWLIYEIVKHKLTKHS